MKKNNSLTRVLLAAILLMDVSTAQNVPITIPHKVDHKPFWKVNGSSQDPDPVVVGQDVTVTWKIEASTGYHTDSYNEGDPVPTSEPMHVWGIKNYNGAINGDTHNFTLVKTFRARRGDVHDWSLGQAWCQDPCDGTTEYLGEGPPNVFHILNTEPAPPNTGGDPDDTTDPIGGISGGGETSDEAPDQGEVDLPNEIVDPQSYVQDPARGSVPTHSAAYLFIKKTDLTDPAMVGSNDVTLDVVHRIVTINNPDERDLEGSLKLELESGVATDYVIFRKNPLTGAGEQITLPFTMNITEPGHEGDGVHDWHAGTESFIFRRTGNGPLKLKYSVDPTEGSVLKTASLWLLSVELDVNDDGDYTDPCDGLATYLPGYVGDTAVLHKAGKSFMDSQYDGPQRMRLILPGIGSAKVDSATFKIVSPSNLSGFCGNGSLPNESPILPYNDFSFTSVSDSSLISEISGNIESDKIWAPIYCKDYGAWCEVEITLRKNGVSLTSSPIRLTLPNDSNGDKIADCWQDAQINAWNNQYGTNRLYTNAERNKMKPDANNKYPDDEEADFDGPSVGHPAMAAAGDGLSVLEEYRGFILDGGPTITASQVGPHKRLSAVRKELLVECSEETDIPSPANLQQNANMAAGLYNLKLLMGSVSGFYNGPNGADIDLYWCRDDFKRGNMVYYGLPWPPQNHLAFFKDGVPLAYTVSNPPPSVAGYANIHHDRYLFQNDRSQHDVCYGSKYSDGYPHMANMNRNDLLSQFVKLNMLTRNGLVHIPPDIVHIQADTQNAFNILAQGVPDAEYQGSFIFVNGIAEEGRFKSPSALYNQTQFDGVLAWATAHELSHMIGNPDTTTPGSLMGSTAGTVISAVSFINSEIQQINLRARLSVKK